MRQTLYQSEHEVAGEQFAGGGEPAGGCLASPGASGGTCRVCHNIKKSEPRRGPTV